MDENGTDLFEGMYELDLLPGLEGVEFPHGFAGRGGNAHIFPKDGVVDTPTSSMSSSAGRDVRQGRHERPPRPRSLPRAGCGDIGGPRMVPGAHQMGPCGAAVSLPHGSRPRCVAPTNESKISRPLSRDRPLSK